jgi:glycosyltransferase 2 family protein
VSYAVLIATWRAMVGAWGARIGAADAARIWFVSNLGRYVPGKVWQIGAMGVMAQDAGVPATAAVGSALVISLVNILAGFAVVAVTGGGLVTILAPGRGGLPVVIALLALGVIALPWVLPPLITLASRITRRELAVPRLPQRAIWIAGAGCAAAWVLYGLAFRELSVALLGSASGDAATYVAVFTLSYLIGFLFLPAPGGIGVRELSMGGLLVSAGLTGEPAAAVLVIASRLWLTVLEIVPGLLFLARPRAASIDRTSP